MLDARCIPIENYFDDAVYEMEMQRLFKDRPQYIGATTMFKKNNDYHVVDRLNGSKILFLKSNEYHLLDNICAHRQAKMLTTSGNSRHITCPLHRWSYEADTGQCIRTPLYPGEKSDLCLRKTPVEVWNNLLFAGNSRFGNDVNSFPLLPNMEIDKMVYTRTVTEQMNYNWKHYIDVYCENYHIPFIHPTFNSYLDIDTIEWMEHPLYHAQMFKPRMGKAASVYRNWQNELLTYYSNGLPEYAGILLMCYPNIMIEAYPLFMVICSLRPTGTNSCVGYFDYFHHQDVVASFPRIMETAEAAYTETVTEDADLCERIAEGRRYLYEQGRDETGPYQAPYEDGLAMFHRYYERSMGPIEGAESMKTDRTSTVAI